MTGVGRTIADGDAPLAARGSLFSAWLPALLPPLCALLITMAVGSLLILLYGQSPLRVYGLMLRGTFGTAYGVGQTLFKATPLLFCGLSVALAFRAGLFNIGAEGQIILGALATAIAGAALPAGTPLLLALPACLAAALLAGSLWGLLPGLLKVRFGAHEVISTIMLNFIAQAIALGLGGKLFLKESLHTAPVVAGARLPRLASLLPALHGSAANLALMLALAAAAACAWMLFRTRWGFELRAAGLSPPAAECSGIPVGRTLVLAMAAAGGLAGLGSVNYVLGYKYYFEDGFAGGVGFMGIAVALLGRNHPAGVVLAALLFGALSQGGLAINALVPKELIEVLQAVVILSLAASSAETRRLLRRRPASSPPEVG